MPFKDKEVKKAYHKEYNKKHYQANKEKYKSKNAKYEAEHKEELQEYRKQWAKDNPDKVNSYSKKWRDANKEYFIDYRENNIEEIRKYQNERNKEKRKNDPVFKLRNNISQSIVKAIKRNGSKKSGSILDHLPYTMESLREHLEKQFEPWMTWQNHGRYDTKTWDDNDSSTWTWQIDHIIPQSILPYSSMEDENFQKCWALENLRPYSAKQNSLDSDRSI
jgi:hypothetical protein